MTRAGSKSRLRILCVTSSLRGGGAERVLAVLASEFVRKGHLACVTTFLPPSEQDYPLHPRVQRETLNVGTGSSGRIPSAIRNLRRASRLRTLIRQWKPDVVLSFMTTPSVVSIIAGMAEGVPVVVSERVDPRAYVARQPWRLLRRSLYPAARRVVLQTEGVASGWARSFLRNDQIVVLPNPVSSSVHETPLPMRDRDRLILAAGRLDPQKGFDVLLKAYAAASQRCDLPSLEIAGEGPERPILEALISELKIGHRVALLGRVKEIRERMRRAQFFVLSSRFEGFPNVMLEALSEGTPVIATDCMSGPREVLGTETTFPLVPAGDSTALAAALVRSHESPFTDEDAIAAKTLTLRFNIHEVGEAWLAALEEACAR